MQASIETERSQRNLLSLSWYPHPSNTNRTTYTEIRIRWSFDSSFRTDGTTLWKGGLRKENEIPWVNPKIWRRQVVEYRVVCTQTMHDFRIIVSRKARESIRWKKEKRYTRCKTFRTWIWPPPLQNGCASYGTRRAQASWSPFALSAPSFLLLEKRGRKRHVVWARADGCSLCNHTTLFLIFC